METIVSAKEMSATLESALPLLAGKISGLGTAMLSNKLPTPSQVLNIVSERSKEDIGKIRNFLENQKILSFSETFGIEEFMGDLIMLVMVAFAGKSQSRVKFVSNQK